MQRLLIFSDIHLREQDIEECNLVFDELISLSNKHSVDTVISLGDNFDNNHPNALELNCFAEFIKKLGNKEIILLAAQSHESETTELSSVDIYGILTPNVKVVKEFIDKDKLYCGHFIVSEAIKGKFGSTISKNTLKKYKYVFLGHQHQHEIIKPNVCQLGSCRWINFDESQDKNKIVALIEGYDTETPKLTYLPLKSPYPMKDIGVSPNIENSPISASNLTHLRGILDSFSPKTKIRCIFSNYNLWREFLPFESVYKEKFILFRIKKDFVMNEIIIAKKEKQPLRESLVKWMDINKVDDKIREILINEIK
jgi:DNA repair exonuclease SbcCD nuclease subunit